MAKIIFFGNERIATGTETTAPTLQALIAAGHEVLAVIVAQEAGGRSRKTRPLEVAEVAASHNITVLSPQKLSEIREQIVSLQPDIGVLVAYGKLVPQAVIDIFPSGIINIHPSLLPAHRGSIPLEAALLNGDDQTGVSLMQLVREMDAGPTYSQAVLPLDGSETKQELADRLIGLGKDMLIDILPRVVDGSLQANPQPTEGATYDARLDKNAGLLLVTQDWNRPAIEIERMVRAFAGWPRVKTQIGGYDVIITSCQVGDSIGVGVPGRVYSEGKILGIYTSDGVLLIDSLIPAGKKEMPISAFLSGYSLNN